MVSIILSFGVPILKGRAEGKLINKIVDELLNKS